MRASEEEEVLSKAQNKYNNLQNDLQTLTNNYNDALASIADAEAEELEIRTRHANQLATQVENVKSQVESSYNSLVFAEEEELVAQNRLYQQQLDLERLHYDTRLASITAEQEEQQRVYNNQLEAEELEYALKFATEEERGQVLLAAQQEDYDKELDVLENILSRVDREFDKVTSELVRAKAASEKRRIQREKAKAKLRKEAQLKADELRRKNFIDPNKCYTYSKRLNRDNKIITEQGCSYGKPTRQNSIEGCAKQCTDAGTECKAFRYRKDEYENNNCWLSRCDGGKDSELTDISKYGLQTGDKDYQFQTYHKTQAGQTWNWNEQDRDYANSVNNKLCPRAWEIGEYIPSNALVNQSKESENKYDDINGKTYYQNHSCLIMDIRSFSLNN